MAKKFNQWLDEFVESGADAKDVTNWPENAGGGTTVVANPPLVGDEPDLTGLEVDGAKYKVPQGGGGTVGHTLTVQFSTVYDRGSDIPPAQYQVFGVALLKYLNGNTVISIETINDNNEHTFENVIAYTYTFAGNTEEGGEPTEEVISETGIMCDLPSVYDADNNEDFGFMTQLFTNSNKVVKYVVTLPA